MNYRKEENKLVLIVQIISCVTILLDIVIFYLYSNILTTFSQKLLNISFMILILNLFSIIIGAIILQYKIREMLSLEQKNESTIQKIEREINFNTYFLLVLQYIVQLLGIPFTINIDWDLANYMNYMPSIFLIIIFLISFIYIIKPKHKRNPQVIKFIIIVFFIGYSIYFYSELTLVSFEFWIKCLSYSILYIAICTVICWYNNKVHNEK